MNRSGSTSGSSRSFRLQDPGVCFDQLTLVTFLAWFIASRPSYAADAVPATCTVLLVGAFAIALTSLPSCAASVWVSRLQGTAHQSASWSSFGLSLEVRGMKSFDHPKRS